MKLRTILIPTLAALAIILFCTVLTTLPAVTIYEAKTDAYSANQTDPAIKSLMTTDESAMMQSMMEEMVAYAGTLIQTMSEGDIEYLKRELAANTNLINKFKTNINKLKLTGTELNTFSRSASELNQAFTILGDDTIRATELLKKQETATAEERKEIDAELNQITAEAIATLTKAAGSAETMITVAKKTGINTASLETLLTNAAQSVKNTTEIKESAIIFTMSPMSGIYGDTITIFGKTTPKTKLNISYGHTLWGTTTSDAYGDFSAKLTIGNISSGKQRIFLKANNLISKPAWLNVLMTGTKLSIKSVKQNKTELGTEIRITGVLSTEKGKAVTGAPVSVINADDGTALCSGITNKHGIWEAAVLLPEGSYTIYADFSDISFPLNESTSEETTFTIGGFALYYLLLPILGGCAAYIIWRIVRKRKTGETDTTTDDTLAEDIYVTNYENVDELFIGTDKTYEPFIEPAPLAYPAGLPAAKTIRELYRCVAFALAETYNIEKVSAKTPRELCAELPAVSDELTSFMNRYERFRYSNTEVSDKDIESMRQTALSVSELKPETKSRAADAASSPQTEAQKTEPAIPVAKSISQVSKNYIAATKSLAHETKNQQTTTKPQTHETKNQIPTTKPQTHDAKDQQQTQPQTHETKNQHTTKPQTQNAKNQQTQPHTHETKNQQQTQPQTHEPKNQIPVAKSISQISEEHRQAAKNTVQNKPGDKQQ